MRNIDINFCLIFRRDLHRCCGYQNFFVAAAVLVAAALVADVADRPADVVALVFADFELHVADAVVPLVAGAADQPADVVAPVFADFALHVADVVVPLVAGAAETVVVGVAHFVHAVAVLAAAFAGRFADVVVLVFADSDPELPVVGAAVQTAADAAVFVPGFELHAVIFAHQVVVFLHLYWYAAHGLCFREFQTHLYQFLG